MASEHTLRKRVEFHETDMAGVVHFSNFLRYVESAEHDLFRSLNIPLHNTDGTTTHGWPRLSVTCDYISPLHFQDEIDITIVTTKKSKSTITYRFLISKVSDSSVATPAAKGSLTIAYARINQRTTKIKLMDLPIETNTISVSDTTG